MAGLQGFTGIEWYDAALRVLVGLLMGMLVGVERERAGRPAGMRTQALVALGAAMYTIISVGFHGQGVDPSRIAAQIVTGIGFLGAGTILRHGNMLQGLTTAASVWVSAAIGMACGLGWYPMAAIGTVLSFGTMSLLRPLESSIRRVERIFVVQMWIHGEKAGPVEIMRAMQAAGARVQSVQFHPTGAPEVGRAVAQVTVRDGVHLEEVVRAAQGVEGVADVVAGEVEA